MKTSSKAPRSNHSKKAIADLSLKAGTDVRGGREATVPAVSEIVVTKTQDCSSTGLY